MTNYDTLIIGAGMSGLAAGIRLAMFDQKVCVLERHKVPGGLNSYYERKGRKLDVGLHAMTNFAQKGERGRPLTKLLKQLRIPYEKLELSQQNFSRVAFPGYNLAFPQSTTVHRGNRQRSFRTSRIILPDFWNSSKTSMRLI